MHPTNGAILQAILPGLLITLGLPLLTPLLTFSQHTAAIIILTLNAASMIPLIMESYRRRVNNDRNMNIKFLILASVKSYAELVKGSTLLSVIALTELFRTVNLLTQRIGNSSYYIIVIVIYMAINILIKLLVKVLETKFFKVDHQDMTPTL